MLKMKNVGNPGAESRVPPWDINSFVKSQLINIIYSPLLAAAHGTLEASTEPPSILTKPLFLYVSLG